MASLEVDLYLFKYFLDIFHVCEMKSIPVAVVQQMLIIKPKFHEIFISYPCFTGPCLVMGPSFLGGCGWFGLGLGSGLLLVLGGRVSFLGSFRGRGRF